MTRLLLIVALWIAGCGDTTETVTDAPPPPSPQEVGWPDTTAAPYVPLDRLLRPPYGSGRYLTDGTLSRLDPCPPCPPDVHCEPCPPDGFMVRGVAPGGAAEIRVEVPQGSPPLQTLSEVGLYLLTIDASVWRRYESYPRAGIEDSTESVVYTLRGLRPLDRRPFTERVWSPTP